MSATGDSTSTAAAGSAAPASEPSGGVDPREAAAIREVLVLTPGVQSVCEVVVHRHWAGSLVTAVLGFGPSTPVSDVVAVLREVKAGIRAAVPSIAAIVLEPDLAGPRDDMDTPTDVIVIRGAD